LRGTAKYPIPPETRKHTEPSASGRHTSRSYAGSEIAVAIARLVETLKKSVPADWIAAVHHAARPPRSRWRSRYAARLCRAPPVVNRIEPAKNVTASAVPPTSFA
jgi:hypothetical protein